jgi:plasmid stabilization system protein ParE
MAPVRPLAIRYLPPAERDIHELADYLLARNPDAAARVRSAILRTLEIAAHFPELGRRQLTRRVRKLVVPRYGYLIYFVDPAANELIVLRIRHGRQRRSYKDR